MSRPCGSATGCFLLHLMGPLGLVPAVIAPRLAIPNEAERAAGRLLTAHPHLLTRVSSVRHPA